MLEELDLGKLKRQVEEMKEDHLKQCKDAQPKRKRGGLRQASPRSGKDNSTILNSTMLDKSIPAINVTNVDQNLDDELESQLQ